MANKPEVPVVTVDSLILEAGAAGATMYSKAKEAAKLAAPELDPLKSISEAVALVVTAHKAAFDKAGHNVKAIFTDAIWLLAAPKAETVEIKIAGTPDNKPHNVKAAEALEQPKHAMRDAAKQVREAHGAGRKAGGGRKAETKPAPVETPNWQALMPMVLGNPGEFAKLVAMLEAAGYTVAKKGRTIKAGKPAEQAAAPSMAEQLKSVASVAKDKILAAAA